MKSFSIKDALSAGWRVFKDQLWFFLKVQIIVQGIIHLPQAVVSEINGLAAIPFWIAIFLLYSFLMAGTLKIFLSANDGGKCRLETLFSGGPVFVSFSLGWIACLLITVAGTLLLVIPGIMWSLKYFFFGYFIVDRRLGALQSLKESAMLTEGVKWKLFGLSLLFISAIGVTSLLLFLSAGFTYGFIGGLLGHLQEQPLEKVEPFQLVICLAAILILIGTEVAMLSITSIGGLTNAFVYRKLLAQTQITQA